MVSPPFGSDSRPFILDVDVQSITRLIITDVGHLVTINPDSSGNDASNMLNLYPSVDSQSLLSSLSETWKDLTRGTLEGDWSLWLGDEAPMANRSTAEWEGSD